MADDLETGLESIGLKEHLLGCQEAGFFDWASLSNITEHDLEALDMRLGDRRKLQRAVARRQSWPDDKPLPTPEELSQYILLSISLPTAASRNATVLTENLEAMESSSSSFDTATIDEREVLLGPSTSYFTSYFDAACDTIENLNVSDNRSKCSVSGYGINFQAHVNLFSSLGL